MTVDIRGKVFCNLGPVISGNISDEPVTVGQGLIRTRGELKIKGLITPSVGTTVQLGYESNGKTARIPKVLRVLGSFADPLREITTVSIADKLIWLENRSGTDIRSPFNFPKRANPFEPVEVNANIPRPSGLTTYLGTPGASQNFSKEFMKYNGVCWERVTEDQQGTPSEFKQEFPFAAEPDFGDSDRARRVTVGEEYAKMSFERLLDLKPSLTAKFIAFKCCSALQIAPMGVTLLRATFNQPEFDLSSGYVNVLDKLLASEALVGFLDEAERLIVRPIDQSTAGSVRITEDDIIDLAQLNIGLPPPEKIRIGLRVDPNSDDEPPADEPVSNRPPIAGTVNATAVVKIPDGTSGRAEYIFSSAFNPKGYAAKKLGLPAPKLTISRVQATDPLIKELINTGTSVDIDLEKGDLKADQTASFQFWVTDGERESTMGFYSFTIEANFEDKQPLETLASMGIEKAIEELNDPLDKDLSIEELRREALAKDEFLSGVTDPETEKAAVKNNATRGASSTLRNWEETEYEYEEERGIIITAFDPALPEEVFTAEFNNEVESKTKTTYDAYNRKTEEVTTTRKKAATVAAGPIREALLNGDASDANKYGDQWIETSEYTKWYYNTEEDGSPVIRTDTEREWLQGGPEEEKGQSKLYEYNGDLWKNDTVNAEEAANGEPLTALPSECPIDFRPPTNPSTGATYRYGDNEYEYVSSARGWRLKLPDETRANPPTKTTSPEPPAKDYDEYVDTTTTRLYSWLVKETKEIFVSMAEYFYQFPWPWSEDFYCPFPTQKYILVDKIETLQETEPETGKTQTITRSWTRAGNTQAGQQSIAHICAMLAETTDFQEQKRYVREVYTNAMDWVFVGESTEIHTDREWGVQERPSVIIEQYEETTKTEKSYEAGTWGYQSGELITGEPLIWGKTPNQTAEFENDIGVDANQDPVEDTASRPSSDRDLSTVTATMPYQPQKARLPDRIDRTPVLIDIAAKNYARAIDQFTRGTRYGMSLQLGVSHVPKYPMSNMYISLKGATAQYRANGISYVFDESGIICNVLALFSKGVGLAN